ncbi:MAG: recombinase family protein [Planctomycetota bacterium]
MNTPLSHSKPGSDRRPIPAEIVGEKPTRVGLRPGNRRGCPTKDGGIRHLDSLIEERRRILAVVYMRVSTYRQRKKGNLRNRAKALRRRLHRKGIRIARQFTEAVSGRGLDDRKALRKAIAAARRLQISRPDTLVIVVTDARNRFLRGPYFNGENWTEAPQRRQYRRLRRMAGDVTLATYLKPDAPAQKVRAYEDRVAGESGRRIGRPEIPPQSIPGAKTAERERLRPIALKLKRRGYSFRAIARQIQKSPSTIRRWLGLAK